LGLHAGAVALVTGAASGIGRASAEQFAREGARVVLADVDEAGGRETAQRIARAGGEALFLRVDVSDPDAVAALLGRIADRFGRLDCAHNNAGISSSPQAFHELPAADWHRMLAVNLSSVFWCMQAEIRQMLAQPARGGRRGAIVNTASGAGIVPAPGQPHYTAAKHGVLGLTKCAAAEYQAQGIRANAICPGLTDTAMVRAFLAASPPGLADAVRRTVPGGELGRPEDVAALAVWLCSEQARWVNGQGIVVDGGGVMR
jgi:NAD(P)-dependent dehydrogenase (short-subunit alcohol dehydrogenase family)